MTKDLKGTTCPLFESVSFDSDECREIGTAVLGKPYAGLKDSYNAVVTIGGETCAGIIKVCRNDDGSLKAFPLWTESGEDSDE